MRMVEDMLRCIPLDWVQLLADVGHVPADVVSKRRQACSPRVRATETAARARGIAVEWYWWLIIVWGALAVIAKVLNEPVERWRHRVLTGQDRTGRAKRRQVAAREEERRRLHRQQPNHLPQHRKQQSFSLGERSLQDPEWDCLEDHLSGDEQRVDACKGWAAAGDVDHPCSVYLTDRSVYVHIRPDTLAQRETIPIPLASIRKCGAGPSDQGTPRLVIVFDPVGNRDENEVRGVAVDLRPAERGWNFGRRVTAAWEGQS